MEAYVLTHHTYVISITYELYEPNKRKKKRIPGKIEAIHKIIISIIKPSPAIWELKWFSIW